MSCVLFSPFSVHAKDWDVEVELYLLGTTINGDAGLGRIEDANIDMDFDAILENLDLAGMFHMETMHVNGFGLALDYSFMDLSDDLSGPRDGIAEASLRQAVLQADALYRKKIGKHTLDSFIGIRWWDNDIDITLDSTFLASQINRGIEEDWIDVYVGGRWIAPITDNLDFMLRGDVGGFGLESDFTASLFGNVRYFITENWALDLGYKAIWVNYETGTKGQPGYYAYDTVTHGPLLGVVYKF